MSTISKFLIASAVALTFASCSDEDPTPNDGTSGEVVLKLDHRWNGNPFALNQSLTHPVSAEGLSFTTLKYYISNVELKSTEGDWHKATDQYFLADAAQGENQLTVKNVPTGSYTDIRFMLGVDSLRNVSGAQEGALAVSNNMFWSWNTGYIFVKAEGTSSTSNSGQFTYHLGGFSGPNAANPVIELSFNGALLEVEGGSAPQVHLMVDPSHLWNGGETTASTPMVHMPGAKAKALMMAFKNGITWDHNHN